MKRNGMLMTQVCKCLAGNRCYICNNECMQAGITHTLQKQLIEKEFTDVNRRCLNNHVGYDDYRSNNGDNASTFALATAGLLRPG